MSVLRHLRNLEPKDLRDGHEGRPGKMSEVRRGTGIRRFKGGWRYNRVQGAMVRVLVQCGTGDQVGSTMSEPDLRYSEVQ